MADETNTLIVRHLPSELDVSDQEDLLRHFGAKHVKCMGNKGRMRHVAFAMFPDNEAAAVALERLHQLQVLGSKLVVEFSRSQFSKNHPTISENYKSTTIGDDEIKKDVPKQEEKVDMKKITENINSMASQWGTDYPLNPRLTYIYPPPSVSILTNIANTLASVPKFYVQVLHLMNRMNLPSPFGPITPTPPLPEGEPQQPPPPQGPNEEAPPLPTEPPPAEAEELFPPENIGHTSTEESELESEEETDRPKPQQVRTKRPLVEPNKPHKKRRIQAIVPSIPLPPKPRGPITKPEEVFDQPSVLGSKKIEFKLASSLPEDLPAGETTHGTLKLPEVVPPTSADMPVDLLTVTESSVVEEGGFGKMEPAPKPEEEIEDNEEDEEWGATEFISSRKLRRGRISSSEMNKISVFRNYQPGEATSRLYIKNLARQVTEKDLHYVYGRYVHWDVELEKNMFDIRLMKEGRMKGQAFITLPSPEVALSALQDTNGFIMHGKPMVVQFARSAKPKEKDEKAKK